MREPSRSAPSRRRTSRTCRRRSRRRRSLPASTLAAPRARSRACRHDQRHSVRRTRSPQSRALNAYPMPLFFMPPHGLDGSLRWWSLIQTSPAFRRCATRCARLTLLVQTAAPSPYCESFASATASSSSLNAYAATTGPNTSSVTISMSGVTSVSTVGS